MRYEIRAVLSILVASSALLSGCKQQSREEAQPSPAATPSAAPAPTPAVAAPTPSAADTIPPPVQPTVPAAAPAGSAAHKATPESIKTCCTALHKESSTAADKGLYTTAATTCDAIDKLVAAGTTKKAAALTQLRAALKGGKLPAGCE